MTRNLALVAAASFVLAVACLSSAAALGWSGLAHHHWGHWPHGDWNIHVRDHDGDDVTVDDHGAAAGGAQTTREIAWNGGERLDLDIGADVTFTQAPGPAKLTISGPSDAVQAVELSGSHLQYKEGDYSSPLTVTLSAPNVRSFAINGSGDLAINGYDQDELDVDVSGSGNVTAKGKARALKLDISGSGDVDAGGLAADSADADISGSGKASIAPASAADLHISGDGEIDLMSHPARLTSDVSGSGHIVEGAPAAGAPPAPPAAPPAPPVPPAAPPKPARRK